MFEIAIENMFENDEISRKYDPKVTKIGVWGGSGAKWGQESIQHQK